MPRGIQDSSKRDFIKKGKIHQAQKCASTLRQERSLESASKRPKSIKLRKKKEGKMSQKVHSIKRKKEKKKKKKRKEKGKILAN